MRRGRATHVLAPHDDGHFRLAALLDQYRSRSDGTWRVVVRYSTAPGSTYVRAMPAADCRPVDDPAALPGPSPAAPPGPAGQQDR